MGEFTHPSARYGYEGVGFGGNRGVVHATAVVELPTTALQTADIVHLMYVPAGATVVDGYVKADDLDTGTSLAYNIGDATTTTLFFSSTTTGQSAGSSAMASAAAGTLIFGLSYFVDPELNVTTGVSPISIA